MKTATSHDHAWLPSELVLTSPGWSRSISTFWATVAQAIARDWSPRSRGGQLLRIEGLQHALDAALECAGLRAVDGAKTTLQRT